MNTETINWEKHLYIWCKLKEYSMSSTFISYRDSLRNILKKFPHLERASLLEIQEYVIGIPNPNTRKNTLVVIRWAFDVVLHRPIDWRDLPYPKRKRKIQPIYTHEEVIALYQSIKNEKQKAIFALLVDQGLRISEVCRIQISDCNSKECNIIIRSAKGGNDRIVYPSGPVWGLIKRYWNAYDKSLSDRYLFDGQRKGQIYAPESIRGFIKQHCKLTGIEYKAVHSFRRYSITWSAEHGASLDALAQRSGHQTTKTIYRHYLYHSKRYIQNAASPLSSNETGFKTLTA